jgi:hypothetical protein
MSSMTISNASNGFLPAHVTLRRTCGLRFPVRLAIHSIVDPTATEVS